MEAFRRRNRLYASAMESTESVMEMIPAAYRIAEETALEAPRPRSSVIERARAMANLSAIEYQPAVTPLEASMLPAQERRPFGALNHIRQSWRVGKMPVREDPLEQLALRRFSGRRSASGRRGLPR